MIVVAHDMRHIFTVCTRLIVLRQVRLVVDLKAGDTDPEEVVVFITGAKQTLGERGQTRARQEVG